MFCSADDIFFFIFIFIIRKRSLKSLGLIGIFIISRLEILRQYSVVVVNGRYDDVAAFNEKLVDWLLWYNGERPHYALGQIAPLRFIMASLPIQECHM